MNDVANFMGGGKIDLDRAQEMQEALKNSAAEGSRGLPDGGVYISFSGKRGVYSIGEAKEDADENELWLVNIYAFEKGFVCWKGGEPVAKRMASIYSAPVPTPDYEEYGPFNADRGDGWYKAKSMSLRSLDRGIQGLFQTNTKSAVNEFSKLESAVADAISEDSGGDIWPVVQLHKEEFRAQGNVNSKPVLNVIGWLSTEQVTELAGMETLDEIADAIDDMLYGNAEAEDEDEAVEEKSEREEKVEKTAARKRGQASTTSTSAGKGRRRSARAAV